MPTFIITLNWADVVSQAHNLDAQLKQIEAKSSEGFHFAIDLQVQIHIPDTQAPYCPEAGAADAPGMTLR